MDFTQIDKLIMALEKGASLRPGSPPVVISGHLGIWRTIRHNRMFLELTNGGKTQGKVLIGPPSFVGNTLADVPSETWANLTPKATLKEFSNVPVAGNGIDTLKQSIKNAVGPDDTRRQSVESFDTKLQLVPIARSAGFTDEEIKMALSGKSPNSGLPEKVGGPKEIPSDLPKASVTAVQGTPTGAKAPSTKPASEPSPSKPQNSPEPTKPSSQVNDTAYINDALARVIQPSKATDSTENSKKIGALLVKLAKSNISDKLLAKEVERIGHGLRSGDYTLTSAKEKLKSIVEDRERAKRNIKVTDKQLNALEDKANVQEFIDNFDKKIEEAVHAAISSTKDKFTAKPAPEAKPEAKPTPVATPKPAPAPEAKPTPEVAPPIDRAKLQDSLNNLTEARRQNVQSEAILNLLDILRKNLKSAEAIKEVDHLHAAVKAGHSNHKSVMFELYKLLRILSLLIPGI